MKLNRFNRNYKLIVYTSTSIIEIKPPMHIVFDCQKSIGSLGLNTLNLKIFNLKESNRNQIVKDKEESKYLRVELYIGYENTLKLVFKGNVERAYPEKQGGDIISNLECLDGLYDVQNSFTSAEVSTKKQAVERIVEDMPNTELGKITTQNTIYKKKVIMGTSYEELKKLLQPDELMFIDNEKLYIIKDNESISNYKSLVNAETGLITIPNRQNQVVEVSTLLNPTIQLGGLVELQSIYAPFLNGTYKVETMSFKGSFDGQDWTQNLKLFQYKGE